MMPTTLHVTSCSLQQTFDIGHALGAHAPQGSVIALSGTLGAGKTHLTKGIARGLSIDAWQRIHSPTFTLLNIHQGGRLPLYHVDFYRIEGIAELPGEVVDVIEREDGVSVVEWADLFDNVFQDSMPTMLISIETPSEHKRAFSISFRAIAKDVIGQLEDALASDKQNADAS